MTMNTVQISFNRLDDDTWGVRIWDPAPGGTRHLKRAGETVEVSLRDGSTKSVTLGEMVASGNGDKGYYRVSGSRARKSGDTDKSTAPKPPVEQAVETRQEQATKIASLEKRVAALEAG